MLYVRQKFSMEVFQLAQLPEHFDTVGTWIYNQWWRTPENSSEIVLSKLRSHMRLNEIPFTLIAVEDNAVIGTCSVIEDDCTSRPQYTPWVAAVYTREDRRGEGVASRLLQEAMSVASECNVERLFLQCDANKVSFYESNGWKASERTVGENKLTIMLRELGDEQVGAAKTDPQV